MRSRASIGGHPLHPAASVAVPIGACTVTLVADHAVLAGASPGWRDAVCSALVVGIVGAAA